MKAKQTAIVLVLLLALGAPQGRAAGRRRALRPTPQGMALVEHVIVIVLENEDGSKADLQPFLGDLAHRGAQLTNYHALAHPSQPNYIAMVAGSAYGVTNDDPVTMDVPHLGDLVEAKGMSWKVYAELYPGNCFTGRTAGNPRDGYYVQRHVPFLSFKNIYDDPARCNRSIVEASQFDRDLAADALPAVSFYIPNTIHDGHDGTVADADTFMLHKFGPLLDDPKLRAHTLFIVTFDEGRTVGPNVVYCVFYGAGIIPGVINADFYDHYSLLRTIEEIFNLGTLQHHDATADLIQNIWTK